MTDELVAVAKKFGSLSEYSIQLNRWILKPIGAWSSSSSTAREKIMSKILVVICSCFSLFTIIPSILRIIFEDEDIYLKLKMLGPISHWLIGGINYVVLLLHKNDIRSCIEHVQADWKIVARPKDQQVMLRYAKVGRYITGFCAGFMQGGVFCYCVMLGIFKQSVKIGNETVAVYSVPCPPYKLPIYTNPTHSIVLATQFLSGFIVSSSAVAAFSLNATFANHALGQLNVINMWINEFVNYPRNQSKDSCVNEIDVIVEHHLRILSFIARIEHMLCLICMMETFKCTLGMCMPSYLILAEWSDHNIQNLMAYSMIFLSMTFNIFLVCYIGEILTEQCKKVGDVVYMTNWYELPDKDILNLIMIISRSSKEVKITAGKLVTMSVYTFDSQISFRILKYPTTNNNDVN
ncbi:PREDICTED: odorant receptor 82a-like [Eufriesea mexicana]|uniref:odorant receptor 82a-like n=1 Tax=Eufriesea mexicana TaxID=516756 RepID=UPI00083BED19|nr:PREDICTED: odorant receptor 82a-like [Eufriesea mexicana]